MLGASLLLAKIHAAPCRHDSGSEVALGAEFDVAIVRQYEAVRQLGLDTDTVFVSGIYAACGNYVFMVCRECETK